MKPHDDYRNGDEGAGGEDSSEEETSALEDELSVRDDAAPARVLHALNALRKSRQHYDAVLLAGGAELPAHRAVLAAASPYLLHALGALPPAGAPALRVDGVEPEALGALVEYAYTGRLRVRDAAAARRLYRAAWRLRVEPVRAHLAAALLRRLAPHDCLELRALPDLGADQLAMLDAYIAQNFDEVCKSGALANLPIIRIEMLRETSAEGGEETAFAVADAALTWLRDQQAADADLDELCSRTHLLYVDARGALRDCGELPAARGDAPELQEYRREAAERGRSRRAAEVAPAPAPAALQLGARTPRAAGGARRRAGRRARGGGGGAARAPGAGPRGARHGGAGGPPAGVRRLRPRASAARRGGVRPGAERVVGAAGHALCAGALPGGGAGRRAVRAGRLGRARGAGLGGVAVAGRVELDGARAAAAGAVARGRGGRGGAPRAVRGGRLVGRRQPEARAALRPRRRRLERGAAAQRRSVAMRQRVLGGRAVGAGRLRRVALPGQHGAPAPGRRRVGGGPGPAHGAALRGRGGVARETGGRGWLGRRGVAAAHGVARGGRGRRQVARRARDAAPARRGGARRAARRALRGGRLRRQGVPVMRGVSVRARRRVDHTAGAAGASHAALSRHARSATGARDARGATGTRHARERRRGERVTWTLDGLRTVRWCSQHLANCVLPRN